MALMRSEGFFFLTGGVGAGLRWPRFRGEVAERSQACSLGRGHGDWPSVVSSWGRVGAAVPW